MQRAPAAEVAEVEKEVQETVRVVAVAGWKVQTHLAWLLYRLAPS